MCEGISRDGEKESLYELRNTGRKEEKESRK